MRTKQIVVFLIIVLVSHLTSLYFPWWIFVPVSFVIIFLSDISSKEGWWISFLAVFFLWLVYAIWLNNKNTFILSNQVGELFGGIPGWALIILGALVAGILSGLAGWTGSSIRKMNTTK